MKICSHEYDEDHWEHEGGDKETDMEACETVTTKIKRADHWTSCTSTKVRSKFLNFFQTKIDIWISSNFTLKWEIPREVS